MTMGVARAIVSWVTHRPGGHAEQGHDVHCSERDSPYDMHDGIGTKAVIYHRQVANTLGNA